MDSQTDTTENITFPQLRWQAVKWCEIWLFYSFDIDPDPMTLVLELDPDIIKLCLCVETEVTSSSNSKVLAKTDGTHGQTDTIKNMHK